MLLLVLETLVSPTDCFHGRENRLSAYLPDWLFNAVVAAALYDSLPCCYAFIAGAGAGSSGIATITVAKVKRLRVQLQSAS